MTNERTGHQREPLGYIILDGFVLDVKEHLRRFPYEFTPAIYDRFIEQIIALRPGDAADVTGVACDVNPDPDQAREAASFAVDAGN